MKRNLKLAGTYFCGNKISDYGIEHKRLDYRTLAKSFDAVLNNNIISELANKGFYFEPVNGSEVYYEDENGNTFNEYEDGLEEHYNEVFQYYIISSAGAEILMDYTNEIVWYCEELDMYVWGVTHWGTSWDYVLTDIPCCCTEE